MRTPDGEAISGFSNLVQIPIVTALMATVRSLPNGGEILGINEILERLPGSIFETGR
jgi:hypothetical protein